MRKLFRFFMHFFLFGLPLFLAVATDVSHAQIVINEFMSDPARDWDGDGAYSYRDDEWLEIANLGAAPVDLDGYMISDGTGEPVWRYAFTGILAPGGVKVVYGSDSRAWEESAGFGVYGLSLNNTGDMISLYLAAEGETVLVDSVEYGGAAYQDDRSAGLAPGETGVWEIFDAYNPCTGTCDPPGNGCVPTPGLPNTCTTSAQSVTWGSIKSAVIR